MLVTFTNSKKEVSFEIGKDFNKKQVDKYVENGFKALPATELIIFWEKAVIIPIKKYSFTVFYNTLNKKDAFKKV